MLTDISPIIEDFLIGFQRNPEGNAEDSDLRRDLYSALYRHFQAQNKVLELPRESLDVAYYEQIPKFRLTPVKTAYPTNEKFDIAVLDTEYTPPPAPAGEVRFAIYWEQPVEFALNLHLCPDEGAASRYLRKLDKDRQKMDRYRSELETPAGFAGLSILLVNGDVDPELGTETSADLQTGLHAWLVGTNGIFAYVAD